jgi:lysophospholipase L1-like esterase
MARLRQSLLVITVVAAGIAIAAALVALGEISVRTLTNVSFQGNSRNLFTADRFNGRTWGNTPDVIAHSFGAVIFTDRDGFRVPNGGYTYPEPASERILILGDSVAFGPGVAEPDTFVGRLRAANPGWAVYNSSVVGYDTGNEADVVGDLIARPQRFSKVILVYCLNDVSAASAINIDEHKEPQGPAGNGPLRELSPATGNSPANLVERLRQLGFISQLNDFLREHSKLYLYLKGISTDPGQRYFLADYTVYRDPAALATLDRLEMIARTLRQRQIAFTVIISPYEYQLRANARLPDAPQGDVLLPQHVVTEFLKSKGIAYVDATAAFKRAGVADKSKLFLKFDPMHFSAAGHRVMYDVIRSVAVTRGTPEY